MLWLGIMRRIMAESKLPSIGCAIITHCARRHLSRCLAPLLHSPLKPRILVVNSSSDDGTAELAREHNVELLLIPRQEFNHGSTREKARKALGTDLVAMLTPDAYLSTPDTLETLLQPLIQKQADAAYARQIPHQGHSFFAAFGREFNYAGSSHIRTLADRHKYGVYTFFFSNSCAAYSNAALDRIGGFSPVLLGEDTVAAAKILRQGGRIAYVAEALVHHSHTYSIKEEFCRHFDIGFARRTYAALLECSSSDTRRGLSYFYQLCKRVAAQAPHLLPYAFLHTAAKWLGYQTGKYSLRAPLWWKKALSTQDYYWNYTQE
jgi:rhamnosyltransferase